MASLQSSSLIFSSSKRSINAAIHLPKARTPASFSIPKLPMTTNLKVAEELKIGDGLITEKSSVKTADSAATAKLYAILEAVADRVEMHVNIGEQRNNWNTLLLNSINMITLAAATMAGVSASVGVGEPLLAFKVSSTLLFSAATGMLLVMNKIQPSQLAEEQRNAARLFRQLQGQIETVLAVRTPTQADVESMMEKVLALDKAYPLPLLGVMIEKFPETFQPAVWWPENDSHQGRRELEKECNENNKWNEKMEVEMREVVKVLKRKDAEDYMRLGNLGLKINKVLAISGPFLTGMAAAASAAGPSSQSPWAATLAVAAGSLATVINTLEHGVQVGMVLEMYRNCAGFFQNMEESIESTLGETELQKRENGELFEMKVALQLGRSLSQLRDLAGEADSTNEFASKLF
ncbi:hypothetical protein PVL29_012415 [Vitis rotundifolia]|uniref:F-box protein n=1 Tax=Vitis rotundifolia TaxID=103349 RepID=A0AA38ZIY4_VITRO|nr:hypothetical protein PVL29_012415 [Vitis rotundifolia]